MMVEDRGKLYLPGYLAQIFTRDEKHRRDELIQEEVSVTIKGYQKAASFLLEHRNTVYGHVPEALFQENHEISYRKNMQIHLGITQAATELISWELTS